MYSYCDERSAFLRSMQLEADEQAAGTKTGGPVHCSHSSVILNTKTCDYIKAAIFVECRQPKFADHSQFGKDAEENSGLHFCRAGKPHPPEPRLTSNSSPATWARSSLRSRTADLPGLNPSLSLRHKACDQCGKWAHRPQPGRPLRVLHMR